MTVVLCIQLCIKKITKWLSTIEECKNIFCDLLGDSVSLRITPQSKSPLLLI
jgi:hypothetical protein